MFAKRVSVVLGVVTIVAVGCGGDDGGSNGSTSTATGSAAATGDSGSATSVAVTEKDFAIAVAPSSEPAGDVTFDVTNDGPSTHEFVVFRTDLAADQLPTNDDGTVNEEGEGVEHIDEIEDITAGSTQSLSVQLDAGNYVLICNLPGHYAGGMHTGFTVS